MAGHPLRSATDRRLGEPLPHQLANQTRAHPIPPEFFTLSHARPCAYAVLAAVSSCYPPVWGRLPTRYSPVRHSVTYSSVRKLPSKCFVRLACVKHAASVHPEPGSNSHVLISSTVSGIVTVLTNNHSLCWLCFKSTVLKDFPRLRIRFKILVIVQYLHNHESQIHENLLRRWDLLTLESCSYVQNSKCFELCEIITIRLSKKVFAEFTFRLE